MNNLPDTMVKAHARKATDTRLFFLVFGGFMFAHLCLIYSLRLYPFADLPGHLASATIFRFYADPANQFAKYYEVSLYLRPNLFHFLFCGLPVFPSVEAANRIFHCMYVAMFPLSVLLLIKKCNGNQWFSLPAFVLLYSNPVSWGLVDFVICIPLVLFLLYFMHAYFDMPSLRHKITVALLLPCIFFIHALAALFSIFVFVIMCAFYSQNSWKTFLQKASAAVPLIVVMLAWLRRDYNEPGVLPWLLDYYTHHYGPSFFLRRDLLIMDNFHLGARYAGYAIGMFFSLPILLPAVRYIVLRGKECLRRGCDAGMQFAFLFCLSAFLYFMCMPHIMRFSVYVLIACIVINSIAYARRPSWMMQSAICVFCAVHFFLWLDYFADFEKENRFFTKEFFPPAQSDAILTPIMHDTAFRGHPVYHYFHGYYTVWRQGLSNLSTVDMKLYPVLLKELGGRPGRKYLDLFFMDDDRRQYLTRLDYALERTDIPHSPGADFRLLRTAGKWQLYQKAY